MFAAAPIVLGIIVAVIVLMRRRLQLGAERTSLLVLNYAGGGALMLAGWIASFGRPPPPAINETLTWLLVGWVLGLAIVFWSSRTKLGQLSYGESGLLQPHPTGFRTTGEGE